MNQIFSIRKNVLALLFMLLLFVVPCLLASCTEQELFDPVIASVDRSNFVVVYSDGASEAVRTQAARLASELERLYGYAPDVVTDKEPDAQCEIRVGSTARSDSILPADKPYATAIAVDADKDCAYISLEAAREDLLERVVDRLLEATPATEGILYLSDVAAFLDDGKEFCEKLAFAVNGVTDYTVVIGNTPEGIDPSEEVLVLEWIARRLQLAGFSLEISEKIPTEGHYILAIVEESMTEDWTVTSDAAGNITVFGRTPHMTALGLVELAGQMSPNTYGDILLPVCETVVGDGAPYIYENWSLAVPACRFGTLASAFYEIGSGLENDNKTNTWSSGRMEILHNISEEDFQDYCELLVEHGYVMTVENTMDGMLDISRYRQYNRGLSLVFVSYTADDGVLRVIEDRASVSEKEFEYSFDHSADTPTDVILYGLKMHPQGINSNEEGGDPTIHNCGALLMIAQADGSLFVIDCGSELQATEAAVDGLWEYMHDITNTPEGEPIRIACWFMTHPHSDHYALIESLIKDHHEDIRLERVLFNFQHARFTGHSVHDPMRKVVRDYYPNALYIKCHTGQSLTLGSLTLDVMATHEDAVNLRNGATVVRDSNSLTAVLRVTMADDSRIMILGDVTEERDDIISTAFDRSELTCDMVQIAHHAWNSLPRLYRSIGAEYTLWPQYEPSKFIGIHYDWAMNVTKQVTNSGAEHFFYAGVNTTCITWKNGEATVEHIDVIS